MTSAVAERLNFIFWEEIIVKQGFVRSVGVLLLSGMAGLAAASETPQCLYDGTRSEGWYQGGQLIGWADCSEQVAVCLFSGTRSEGWYSMRVEDIQQVRWDNCAESLFVPQCGAIGSRSEGWYSTDPEDPWRVWAQCAEREVACLHQGSRSEGWYSFVRGDTDLIKWEFCSGHVPW